MFRFTLAAMAAETLQARVGSDVAGERLDRFLAVALAGFSRSRLKNLVESGQVSLGGATVTDPAMRVKPGQVFILAVPPPETASPEPQAMELDIRFEDEHLLVLNKPAGLVVHPAPGNPDRTLVNALLAHCGESLAGIGGVKRPGIVHRLDKDTSGLMVVAKNDAAHRALARDFAAHVVTRAYQAVVWGVPQPRSGEISGRIGRNPRDRKKMAVVSARGKAAVTRYKVLKVFGAKAALVECRLATGRTHQIRVHMTANGHPLIGDPTYGRQSQSRLAALPVTAQKAAAALGRQALHAYLLGFRHPANGEYLELRSNLPNDISNLIDSLDSI
ncbi:MAG: RluA family pseudouridine synthase [Stellaceae bacterium]